MVARGKTSSGSTPKMVGFVLLLSDSEASKRRTVVIGGVVRPLVVEAIGGIIPYMTGCVLFFLAVKVIGEVWWQEARPVAVASSRLQGVCYVSWSVTQSSDNLWWREVWCAS